MLAYVYHTLHTFRKVFTRHATWLTFCVVVLGFLGSTQIDGVSSLCRFWGYPFKAGRFGVGRVLYGAKFN
jgi:hypothetical protein